MRNVAPGQYELLERLKLQVENDDRFIGLWTVGSMATRKADRYSDVDVYLLIEKEDYDNVFAERASFVRNLGKVLSSFEVQWPNCQLYGAILDGFVELDLCYCTPEQAEVFGPYSVIVDKKGDLEEFLKKRAVKFEAEVKKHLAEHMDFAAYNLLHAINMLGRGEYWSAIRQVEILRKRAIGLIGLRTETDVEEEYRKLEGIINDEESKRLRNTLCTYDSESIGEAIENTARLLLSEAEKLCRTQKTSFPSDMFESLLQHLNDVRSEKRKQQN